MSTVTTSVRINQDKLDAALPAGYSWLGAKLEIVGPKAIFSDVPLVELQAAIASAAGAFVDRAAIRNTLINRVTAGLNRNTTFISIANPTQIQKDAHLIDLTRTCSAMARLIAELIDTTAGT